VNIGPLESVWRAVNAFVHWRYFRDVVGVSIIVLLALLYLSPALKDGFSFGPTDLISNASLLTNHIFSPVAHNHLAGDTGDQGVPWNAIDWRIVHNGEIPLWNSTAGTGLPQLFNFESAAFALPTLLGYLFPLSASFLVTVLGKLLIAGIGTYVCCRVLGTGAAGATLGGSTFMLSGSFAGWLGWSISGPVAWSGFILAGIALAYRSRRRARDLWLLALSIAFAIYGGFPEMYPLMAAVLLCICGVAAIGSLIETHRLALRGISRVLVASAAGLALSAPLWFPGLSVISHSARSGKHLNGGLEPHLLSLVFAQGYYGLPIAGSTFLTNVTNYYESATYLGVIAIVCAVVALVVAYRRGLVIGLALGAFVTLALCYSILGGIGKTITTDVGLGADAVHRGLPLLGFCAAVLAGIGCDILVRRFNERAVRIAFAIGIVLVAFVLGLLWRGANPYSFPPSYQALRRESLWWPTATMALLLLLYLVLFATQSLGGSFRRWIGRLLAAALVCSQGAFLVVAGVGINSYFRNPFPTTPGVVTLQRVVGSGMFAADTPNITCANPLPSRINKPCGVRLWEGYGFIPNVQGGYGIDELGMHDPVIPQSYFNAWPVPDSGQTFKGNVGVFSPSITSVALARRYGVTDVLVPPGVAAPKGMKVVAEIPYPHNSPIQIASVPGSARFTFLHSPGAVVTSASHPGDASYDLHVRVRSQATLVLHVTYVPGWHLSANGRPVALSEYQGMMKATLPAGTTVVVAHYWPRAFTEGIILAVLALVALACWPLLPLIHRFAIGAFRVRRPKPPDAPEEPPVGAAADSVTG
jgi:hypothetical protein